MAYSKISTNTFVLSGDSCTFSELKAFVSDLEKLNVPDSQKIRCNVHFEYKAYGDNVDFIVDGESSPWANRHDIIVTVDFE